MKMHGVAFGYAVSYRSKNRAGLPRHHVPVFTVRSARIGKRQPVEVRAFHDCAVAIEDRRRCQTGFPWAQATISPISRVSPQRQRDFSLAAILPSSEARNIALVFDHHEPAFVAPSHTATIRRIVAERIMIRLPGLTPLISTQEHWGDPVGPVASVPC